MQEFISPLSAGNDANELQNTGQNYSFALNATIENISEPQPEPYRSNSASNVFCYELKTNEKVVGSLYISEWERTILFVYNTHTFESQFVEIIPISEDPYKTDVTTECSTSESEYIIKSPLCESKLLLNSFCFDWSNSPTFTYKISDCSITLYFVNNKDEDRILMLNEDLTLHPDFAISNNDACNLIYSNQIDCAKTKWNPNISEPCIKLDLIPGNKQKGVYSYLTAYSTFSGVPLTSFKSLTQPFHIYEKNGGIKVTIDNVTKNSRYKYFVLVCIETLNGITTYHKKQTLSVDQTIYIDTENGGDNISIQNLTTVFPFYERSTDLTESNNILFKLGVSEYDKFNLQPVISKLELEWVTTIAKEGDYLDPEFAYNNKTFLRDEVYPLGVEILLDNSELGPTFSFVGRRAFAQDLDVLENIDNGCGELVPVRRWQKQNTATYNSLGTTNLEQLYNNCDCSKEYQSGKFGYWESSLKYPNNPEVWGDLCGQPIRHFKFPDVSTSPHFANNQDFDKKNYIFPLGVKIKSDIWLAFDNAVTLGLITKKQRERITGYRIVRGNREGNKSIIAKGLSYDVWSYKRQADKDENFYESCGQRPDETYHYPNYPFNDLNPDKFLAMNDAHYNSIQSPINAPLTYNNNKQKFTFHSPETHFASPNLGNKIKYEAEVYGEAKGFFNKSQDFAEYKLMSVKHYNIAKVFAHFISSTATVPSDEALVGVASNAGKTIGGAIGAVAGSVIAPGVGTAVGAKLGSALGGFVGGLVGTNAVKNSFSSMAYRHSIFLSTMERVLDLLRTMSNSNQHHYQHQSVGKYNQLVSIENRNDEYLADYEYLTEGKQTVKEGDGIIYFNNQDRESSVYFKTKNTRPDYKVQDNSRVLISEVSGGSANDFITNQNIDDFVSYRVSATKGKYKVYYTSFDGIMHEEELNARGGKSFQRDFLCLLSFEIVQDRIFGADTSDIDTDLKVDVIPSDCSIHLQSTQIKRDYKCKCNAPTTRTISSFYVSNKIDNPSQYGNISDIQWLNMNNCTSNKCNNIYFGGDSYIGRFSLKRKQNFFSRNTHKLPENTDFNYSIVPNIANPRYFFDTVYYPKETIFNINNIEYPVRTNQSSAVRNMVSLWKYGLFNVNQIKPGNYNFDCHNDVQTNSDKLIQLKATTGIMYTAVYGVSSFITESSYNLDLRDSGDNLWDKFYPKQSDLSTWLQETNIPIKLDNSYYYDNSFSKQSTESFKYVYDVNFKGGETCKTEKPNRVIYSSKSENIEDDNYSDPYLLIKALDYHDFNKEKGRAISIEGIEGDRVLVRMENTTYVYSSAIQLNTDINTVLLTTGNIFQAKPVEYSSPTNGYFGTQHRAILHTPHGHIQTDCKRGHIHLLGNGGQGLEELSNKGYRHWFKENLPFTISKHFPVNVDDTYNGIGISLVYDRRLETIFISKLDYEPKSKGISYVNNKFWFNNQEIKLTDKKYFRDKCWTMSYSFYRKEWVSPFTWKPLYYIEQIDKFFSGTEKGLWQHNATNKSFQVFYNEITPFIVESTMKGGLAPEILKSVSYYADFIRYHNQFDYYYETQKSFNKALIYGKNSNTGPLNLDRRDGNYFKRLLYPMVGYGFTTLELVIKEGKHSFNQFKNRIKPDYTHLPHFTYNSNNVDKQINLNAFNFDNSISNDYIRDTNLKVRLINDKETRYKIIFKGLILDKDGGKR